MGLLGGISKAIFGDPSKDIQKGVDQQLASQRKQLDYLKRVQKPVLDLRNKALPQLAGFYGLGADAGEYQQQFVDTARQSPFYQSMLDQGEEAVMRNAAATGGVRGGNVQQALAQNSQNVLQGLVNQQLQGLGSFAQTPIDTGGIANVMGQMGQTQAQGTMAMANAEQAGIGQLLGAVQGGLGLAGDLGWKPFGG
jgi:hypothetical protein